MTMDRRTYLGGTDIAAILGLSRYKTALQVWGIKTGQIDAEDVSGKMQVRLGVKFEPVVAELFTEETGKKLARVNEALVHPKHDFLRGHIDRRVVGEKAIVEIKSTSPWRKDEWSGEDAPIDYIIQTMYYMALSNAERGYLVCLIGNQDLKIKIIERDQKALDDLIEKSVHFWNTFVIPRVMPGIIKANDSDTLFALFPEGEEGAPELLDDKADALIDSWQALKEDATALKGQIEKAANEVKALLKDKAVGRSARYTVTWKNQATNRLNTEKLKTDEPLIYAKFSDESKSRVLRCRENKGEK